MDIENSPMYLQTLEMYQKFLKDNKELLQILNIESISELFIFYAVYSYPLKLFTIHLDQNYDVTKEPIETFPKILGAFAFSHQANCAFLNSFFGDVLESMGYDTYRILGTIEEVGHMVTGVIYDKHKILLDMCNALYGYFPGQEKVNLKNIFTDELVEFTLRYPSRMQDVYTYEFFNNGEDTIRYFYQKNEGEIEIESQIASVENKIIRHHQDLTSFHQEYVPKYKLMAQNYATLANFHS